MLVLTRKLGESIVIDGNIVVTVSAISGNRVKIALEAPQSRRIVRGEIVGDVTGAASPAVETSWVSGPRGETARPTPANAK